MASPEIGSLESVKLPLFTPEDIPRARRRALADALTDRRSAIGLTLSCAAMLILTSFMSALYGAASAIAWIRPASPVLGSILAVFSAGFFVASVHFTLVLRAQAAEVVTIPEQIRLLAAAEAGIESEILRANERIASWNSICDEILEESNGAGALPTIKDFRDDIRLETEDLRERILRLGA